MRNDAAIIGAILEARTMTEAAQAAGISRRALYRRMADPAFIDAYEKARADSIEAAALKLRAHIDEAAETLCAVMKNTKQNASARIKAADIILTHAEKLTEAAETAREAARLRAELDALKESMKG